MTRRPGWRRPSLPEGPLRDLNDALHGLHARSGRPSCRRIAETIAARSDCDPISHTTVRATLSDPKLPKLAHVLAIAQVLIGFTADKDPGARLDRFDHLWQQARIAEDEVFGLGDPGIDAAARATQLLHAQRLGLLEQQTIAQREFIRRVAVLLDSQPPDWWRLLEAYDQVMAWNIKGFADWKEIIGFDRPTLRRLAHATPRNADGMWRGDTGWDGLDDTVLPVRGAHVAYALFDGTGKPVHIGMTNQFRAHVKRLHKSGVAWTAWQAWPCTDRQQAVEKRRDVATQYGYR
ncbi:hypothetical protein ACFOWZ_34375 [Lentzea rhizosphaerae]|uniref:GIY-YIG nuclease family protein n=1 Tax=Lentzea rhizosphaerae TaxID=2041025 RepID=A0ABV8C3L3_9PSEU